MDIVFYILSIVFYVQARGLKDNDGNYLPQGLKKRKTALIYLLIGLGLDIVSAIVVFLAFV